MPDSRSLAPILKDLEHAGFKDVVLVTDRGYESIRNLEKYISGGLAMIMCTKVGQGRALEIITAFGDFDVRPDGMDIDKDMRLYYKQYDLNYEVKGTGESVKPADRLRLNLYFDPVRRSEESVTLDIDINAQEEMLAEMLRDNAVCDDDATLKRAFPYFKVTYNRATRVIESYTVNEKKITEARRTSGFFAVTTHKLDMTAPETFRHYRLRDEQEKCFQQMKSQMVCDRQRNWSEEGKTGRLFIMFVAMILGSHVRHVWKSTRLHKLFSSSLEILDEMRPIRCIEHTNRSKVITPFVGMQTDICEAFGFEIPEGCAPKYVSKKKPARKRGRPKRALIERDY
jgi:transposase